AYRSGVSRYYDMEPRIMEETRPPAASFGSSPSTAVPGEARKFTLQATDTLFDQRAGFTFQVDWGDGATPQTYTGLSGIQVTHAYTATGTYTISLTAT